MKPVFQPGCHRRKPCGPAISLAAPATRTSLQAVTGQAPGTLATLALLALLLSACAHSPKTTPAARIQETIDCTLSLQAGGGLPSGTGRRPQPATPHPELLTPTADTINRSCLLRLTEQAGKHPDQYWLIQAPRRQAFNADASRFLLSAPDGYWQLYDGRTGRPLRRLPQLQSNAEPQWHPEDPDILDYLPGNGVGMRIERLTLSKDQSSLLADMGAQLRQYWPDAENAWTIGQGSPSADGRYWCLYAERPSDDGQRWLPRGVFAWDMHKQRIVGAENIDYRPSAVSTSPSGKYCMVVAVYPHGTRIYKQDFSSPYSASVSRPYLVVNHDASDSDLASNHQLQDTYVSMDGHTGDVFMVNLDTTQRTRLFNAYRNGTISGMQFSGKAYRKPGWILAAGYAERTPQGEHNLNDSHPARHWPHRKVFAIRLSAQPEIRSIANLHNSWLPLTGYQTWPAPNITVDRDFTRILFNSSWDSNDHKDIDTYLIGLPDQALDPAAGPAAGIRP